MTSRLLKLLAAAALVLAPIAIPVPSFAATSPSLQQIVLCAPQSVAATSGPRRVVNTSSTASPQPSYNLNAQGCAVFKSTDAGFFLSQGYVQGPNLFTAFGGPYTAQATAANAIPLPAGALIMGICIQETTGNAITGGLDIGIAGSSDATIASAFAVAANAVTCVPGSALLAGAFPVSGAVTGPVAKLIYVNAHTNWSDGASIVVTVLYSYF